ncbi:Acyltransferase [Rhodovastum atsumiense]|nr:Acyltransferase [Rhodovastum atsumiense]
MITKNKLATLQMSRGIAASMVMLFHYQGMLAGPTFIGHTPFGGFFSFGHAGVEFFFVLSGFIIYFVHRMDVGLPGALASYGWKRLTRIMPVYWFILIFYFAKTQATGTLDGATVLRSIVLFPHQPSPLLAVSWTLSHEILFYLVFAVAIAHRRAGQALFLLWGTAILVVNWLAPGT